ncbi:MAG: hypothetical protein OSJ56_13065, partial [Prevotella sp.]|nr:hypothetical protein [Prevotella sp.]
RKFNTFPKIHAPAFRLDPKIGIYYYLGKNDNELNRGRLLLMCVKCCVCTVIIEKDFLNCDR